MRKFIALPTRMLAASAVLATTLLAAPAGFAQDATAAHVTAQDALQALAKRVRGGDIQSALDVTTAMRDYCVAGVGTVSGAYSVDNLQRLVTQQNLFILDALAGRQGSQFIMSRGRGCVSDTGVRMARMRAAKGTGVSPAVTFDATNPTTGRTVTMGPGTY